MRLLHIILITTAIFIAGCKNTPPMPKAPVTSNLSEKGTAQLMMLTSRYYALKNALVASDASKAAVAGRQLGDEAQGAITFLQADQGKAEYGVEDHLKRIVNGCKVIAATDDKSCERQRIPFGDVSEAMYALLKAAGIKNSGAYKQYCPMAFNDKGAYWLSDETLIRNPYFGKKMLECGEVQDTL